MRCLLKEYGGTRKWKEHESDVFFQALRPVSPKSMALHAKCVTRVSVLFNKVISIIIINNVRLLLRKSEKMTLINSQKKTEAKSF